MNENNEIITMEDEKVASMLQKMRKSSRWLSGFLESYRPPLDGEVYLTDKEVADLLRVSRRTLQEYRNERLLPYIILGGKACIPNRDCVRYWKRTIGSLSDSLRPKARTDSRHPVVRSCLRLFRSQQWPPLAIGTNSI